MRRFLPALSLVLLPLIGCGGGGDNAAAGSSSASSSSGSGGGGGGFVSPPWLSDAKILVSGTNNVDHDDCRADICRHNENTDLTVYKGATYLVHRTAESQVLGPNSALHVYRSTDGGASFTQTALIPAPMDRDLRDPHFYTVGGDLYLKALTRLPVNSLRDSNVDTVAVGSHSSDGVTWTPLAPIGPNTWSFWRIKEQGGVFYSAAYEDGDKSVVLFSSTDGSVWTKGSTVYNVSADTPLETELTFMPSGKLLALVRMDGSDGELLGTAGRLRTKVCWSDPPYSAFDCPAEFNGQRLDGPLSFFHKGRLFVVARKHLDAAGRKRTSLFEIKGDLEGGAITIEDKGDLPSAGDTSYAGVAPIDDQRSLLTWYSGDLVKDEGWALAIFDVTDIWQGTIDLDAVP